MVRCKQGKVKLDIEERDVKLDETDGSCIRETNIFSWTDFVGNLISIISFLGDTGSDIFIANLHYRNGDYWYFGLTVTFIVVPAVVMTVLSTIWYVEDLKRYSRIFRVSAACWAVRTVFLILQIGPILRYVDSLIYGLKSRKERKRKQFYYQRMIYEDCDAAFLRLFEAFMEAAPQLVLQIYILAKQLSHPIDKWTVIYQGITIIVSLLSLSWALAYYHRSLRLSLPEKAKSSWTSTVVQICWYLFVIGPRVLCLALLALLSPVSLALFSVIDWGLMFTWIVIMKTKFCETRFQEITYNAVLAVVFIFSYLNPVDKPTRYKYSLYYGIMLIQDTIIIGIWCYFCSNSLQWLRLPTTLFHFLSFIVGIFIMIFYYLLLHPTGGIKIFGSSTNSKNGVGEEWKQNLVRDVNTSKISFAFT